MGRINKKNKKKMVRITPEMGQKILKMKAVGLTLREIGKALGLTHPGVLYYLKGRKNNQPK